MNKKAISPLIATVLIIGFTIVLAAVVMQWGGSFVRSLTEQQAGLAEAQTMCINMGFSVEADSATGTVKITNNKDIVIKDLLIQKIDDTGSTNLVEPVTGTANEIAAYASKPFTGLTFATDNKIRVIPYVTLENNEEVGCPAEVAKTVIAS